MDKRTIRDEIVRCGKNPCYFIKRYVQIQHPVRGLIPFAMFDYQEELVADYVKHRFNIVLKARQLGISEVTAAYAAWLMLFHRDKNILVMATKQSTAMNIIRKVQVALKKLPDWLILSDITTDNKLSIELSNGSRIKAIASSNDAGRSEALSLLIVDEAAHIANLDDLWTGLLPTVTAGGRVIVLSTPNGVGNVFHRLYVESEDEKNDFHNTKLMWWRHPERVADLVDDPDRDGMKISTWYKNEIKATNMSAREVGQELECDFLASGDTVIIPEYIDRISRETLEPIDRWAEDRNLFIWFRPEPGRKYLISADVARGDGRDFSAFHVWDAEYMRQMAEYYGKVPPDKFARVLCDIGREYNNALLVVENNTVGLACLEHVKLNKYPNVYYSRKGDQRPGEAVNTEFMNMTPDMVPGFTTSLRTRPLVISKFEESVRNESMTIVGKRTLNEIRTFIWKNGRAEAMTGYNDDLVMSAAIGAWIRDTYLAPNFLSAEMQEKLIDGISYTRTKHTDIPGASKDPRFVPQRQLGSFSVQGGRQPNQIRLANGEIVDFSWLLNPSITKG